MRRLKWKITGILSSGVGVTTGQSTLDLHPSLDDFSNLESSITLQNAIFNGLFTNHTSQLAALLARVDALEANAVTSKFENGQAQPLKQLQLKTRDISGSAYYQLGGILKVASSTPADPNPY